jgi:hypothetical protein
LNQNSKKRIEEGMVFGSASLTPSDNAGSNPTPATTPATTCENGPPAAISRASGPFLLCPVVCRLVALRVGVSRCPRTHGGRDLCPGAVGAHRRLFYGRYGRAAPAACFGLTCAAKSGDRGRLGSRRGRAGSSATVPDVVCLCRLETPGLMSFAALSRLTPVPRRTGHVGRASGPRPTNCAIALSL